MESIAVFCGSSDGNDKKISQTAYELGKTIAERNKVLVYGGAKVGLMGKVAEYRPGWLVTLN